MDGFRFMSDSVIEVVRATGGLLPGVQVVGCALGVLVLTLSRRADIRALAQLTIAAQLLVIPVLLFAMPFVAFGGGAWLALPGMAFSVAGPLMSVVLSLATLKALIRKDNVLWSVVMLAALSPTLISCGSPEAEPSPAEQVSAAAPKSDAEAAAPVVLTAQQLRQVCRAGLGNIHGQTLEAIQIDGLEGQVVNASWRAPVDGGVRRAQCRVDGDIVTWRPVGGTGGEERWMNQAGDPVARFVLDGDTVTINSTLPDGTTSAETYAVRAEGGSA